MLQARAMGEFASLDRCAAYVAARALLVAVERVTGSSGSWPPGLAVRARRAAMAAVELTAEATAHGPASAGRRRCLRDAITSAIGIAAAVDIARTAGLGDAELVEFVELAELHDVQRVAGRLVALLAMFLHASTSHPR
jgi:hypothetical protein